MANRWIADNITAASLPAKEKSWLSSHTLAVEKPQEATAFALIYGTPLLSYVNLAMKIAEHLKGFTTNTYYHQSELAEAGFSDINRPNLDTLYSEALMDLSGNDLVVTIPRDFPKERFYVLPFYDVYGNNVVNLGTIGVNSAASGRYLVSYRPADPGYRKGDDSYDGYVFLPTPYGAIDLRIEVNGTDNRDIDKVKALQTSFELKTQSIPVQLAPRLTEALLTKGFSTDSEPQKILELTARLSLFCLPEEGSDIAWVTGVLQRAGLARGSYVAPSGLDLKSATEEAIKAVANVRQPKSGKFKELNNGWSILAPKFSGDFKSHYIVRAFVAAQGYLQLKAHQAIYPVYDVASHSITSSKSYTITFDKKPPIEKGKGFWSITVYDEKAFLVPNEWNIYSLGDRSGIVYDKTGEPVYGPGSDPHADGQFTILLQSLSVPPPDKYRKNWIPTPSNEKGGAHFNWNLRFYGPTQDMESGKYKYPVVSAKEPITS